MFYILIYPDGYICRSPLLTLEVTKVADEGKLTIIKIILIGGKSLRYDNGDWHPMPEAISII